MITSDTAQPLSKEKDILVSFTITRNNSLYLLSGLVGSEKEVSASIASTEAFRNIVGESPKGLCPTSTLWMPLLFK